MVRKKGPAGGSHASGSPRSKPREESLLLDAERKGTWLRGESRMNSLLGSTEAVVTDPREAGDPGSQTTCFSPGNILRLSHWEQSAEESSLLLAAQLDITWHSRINYNESPSSDHAINNHAIYCYIGSKYITKSVFFVV